MLFRSRWHSQPAGPGRRCADRFRHPPEKTSRRRPSGRCTRLAPGRRRRTARAPQPGRSTAPEGRRCRGRRLQRWGPAARRQVPEQRRRLRSSLKFSWFKSPLLFRFAPAGCRGSGAGPLWWSGAAPLGHPLDYHPRSVVNWLTRWTFGNSSCKPVTCSVGGGLLFCPLCQQFRPNPPLDGFGELEKLFAHAVHSFRLTHNRSGLSSGSLAVA